ncbi:hypothetical protein [Helicobacter sp. 11S03491-1]|nr:hypothetical protein [Helicobacter sp. 11S03491-1]
MKGKSLVFSKILFVCLTDSKLENHSKRSKPIRTMKAKTSEVKV